MKISYKNLIIIIWLFSPLIMNAQVYDDYFGNGHQVGMTVSGSSGSNANTAENSVNGTDLFPDLAGASRFLAQATLGYNYEEIEYVAQIGIKEWMEEQFSVNNTSFRTEYQTIYDDVMDSIGVTNDDEKAEYLTYSFYEMLVKKPDLLRQKVAFALSQVLVISARGNLVNEGFGNSDYYDILYQNAFGNYKDMLEKVTFHPCMGIYLSTYQNQRADFALGTYPDENYGREVMQLFTIGLHELNNDGTLKLDANGDIIPTYNIVDVQELSKVFTGLAAGAREDGNTPVFATSKGIADLTEDMAMYEFYHDKTEKVMIDGTVLPFNQSGLQDIDQALDILFNHPNVGPFLSIRLIQQLVKSNPTPAYVNRVATVFNNNGAGVRGDLKAVVEAILLDPEARDCAWIDHPQSGKLLQPIERMTNLFVAFDITSPSNKLYFKDANELEEELGQAFLAAPSVFNFFSPFYAEDSYVEPNNMVSPEFQILNTTSGIYYMNIIEDALKNRPFSNRTILNGTGNGLNNNNADEPFLNFDDEINELANNGVEAMLDRLNILLCRGQLSTRNKGIIEDFITQSFSNVSGFDNEDAVKSAVYLIMASPNYTILK